MLERCNLSRTNIEYITPLRPDCNLTLNPKQHIQYVILKRFRANPTRAVGRPCMATNGGHAPYLLLVAARLQRHPYTHPIPLLHVSFYA